MNKVLLLLVMLQYTLCVGWSIFGGGAKEEDAEDAVATEEDTKIVGARIETCQGCRLNYLPRVRNFIDTYLRQFPACSLKYIQGAPPEILWLNIYGQELGRESLEPLNERGIEKLLESKSITRKTPSAPYVPKIFSETEHCTAFRATDECNPKEQRVIGADKSCTQPVGHKNAGNCECKEGLQLPVECGDRSLVLTCEALCKDVLRGEQMSNTEI